MANRTFSETLRVGNPEIVNLYCKFTAVNSGAQTLAGKPHNYGITSVAVSGTGLYTITLNDNYEALLSVKAIADDSGASSGTYFEVASESVQTTTGDAGGTVALQALAGATPGAEALTAGDIVWVELVLLNNSGNMPQS